MNSLEVIYNAALRFATGLLKCTPILLLRREANASSMGSRIQCLTNRFLVRQLSLPHPPLSARSYATSGNLSTYAAELLAVYNVDLSYIIQFSWPFHPFPQPDCHVIIDGRPFQGHLPSLELVAFLRSF